MRLNLILSALGLLSVFGLFSCSSDKPKDSWNLTEPRIEAPGMAALPVSQSSHKTFSGESQIVFLDADISGTTLEIDSQCSSELGITHQNLIVKNLSKIQLKSFWPLELFLNMSEEKLRKSSCSLTFRMTTESGSTHVFELSNIRLSDFENSSEFKIPSLVSQKNIDEVADLLPRVFQSNSNKNLYLICESFWNTTNDKSSVRDYSLNLGDLFFGPLKSVEALKALEVDPRTSNSEQVCRILKRTDFTESKSPETFLTPKFKVWFARPKLETSVRYMGTAPLYFSSSERPTIFEIEIKNTSLTSTAIILGHNNQTLRMQRLVSGSLYEPANFKENTLARGSKISSLPFELHARTEGRHWNKDGNQILELMPNSSVVLSGIVQTSCFMFINDVLNNGQTLESEYGLFYELDRPLNLGQFQEWSSSQLALDGPTEPLEPLRMTTGNSVPQNLIPFDNYLNASMATKSQLTWDIPVLSDLTHALDFACVYARVEPRL